MSDTSRLIDSLKELAAKHSFMKVHTELLALMKEEYAALKGFFDAGAEAPKRKRIVEVPVPVAVEEEIPAKVLANTKIRIIKKAPSAPSAPAPAAPPSAEPKDVPPQEPKVRMDSRELKAWQKEQEGKKLAELTAAGINPETLLTAESIKRWIEDEGRTFAYVAREYVGLPEAIVADFAKGHGVKSKISKSRAILSAKNRRP
jgi:hypothetical protein